MRTQLPLGGLFLRMVIWFWLGFFATIYFGAWPHTVLWKLIMGGITLGMLALWVVFDMLWG